MDGESTQPLECNASDIVLNTHESEEQASTADNDISEHFESADANDDEEHSERKTKAGGGFTGRGLTLQMLLEDNILQPKEGAMSIEYMGQKFSGDLLPDGKIFSAEVQEVFSSPSAWALRCKKIVNPDQRYGCGWSSVRYCGRPLDVYKNQWMKKKRLENENASLHEDTEMFNDPTIGEVDTEKVKISLEINNSDDIQIMKHEFIASRANIENSTQLVETVAFSAVGKLQPFLVSIATSALIVMDVHSALSRSEVVGYLAGSWDLASNTLTIKQAFPCLSRIGDAEQGLRTEAKVAQAIEGAGLVMIGWYHSHPCSPPTPTVQDIDSQLEYQLKLKGNGDHGYRPCVAFISAPLYHGISSAHSIPTICYWVSPPMESRPTELGRPMSMQFTVLNETSPQDDILGKLEKCATFHKDAQDIVNFTEKWSGDLTYLDRVKNCLKEHFTNQGEDHTLLDSIEKFLLSL